MPSSPAFQFYAHDFLAGRVATYSMEEVGAYITLLSFDWTLNGLPNSLEKLAKICRVSSRRFAIIWQTIGDQFPVDEDGRLRNPRLQSERAKQLAYSQAMSENGKRGGRPRKPQESHGLAAVKPEESTPSPSPTAVTTTATTPDASASVKPARRKKTDPPPASSRASWLTPIAAAWELRKGAGTFPWGKAGKFLKPLHGAGHSPESIAANLGRYLDATEAKFVSLPRFVETFGDHAEWVPEGPIVDEWGCLTEYGERITRPPGMRVVA